jgi:hypothetical protein
MGQALGLQLGLGLVWAASGCDAARSSGQAHAEQAPFVRVQGQHRADALVGARGAELSLKDGFWVRPRVVAPVAPLTLVLEVAKLRVSAAELAPDFVPIGPSVLLRGGRARVDAAYRAESFRVRAGHRLVLAVEAQAPCQAATGCWELWQAEYMEGRCVASDVGTYGLRLQFGSLPLSASPPLRSAAR